MKFLKTVHCQVKRVETITMNLSVLIVLSALIFSVSCRWIEIPDNYGNQIDDNFADFPRAFHRSYPRSYKRSSCECGDGSEKNGNWKVQGACSKGSGWYDCKLKAYAVGLICCLRD